MAEGRQTTVSQQLELQAVETPGLTCQAGYGDAKLTVAFTCTGDVAAIELLADYLKRLHVEAERLLVIEVTCDFRQLSFMNSSCFKAFVVWIDTVKNAARSYRIRFLTDPEMHWQRRSLEALRRLAIQIVTLET